MILLTFAWAFFGITRLNERGTLLLYLLALQGVPKVRSSNFMLYNFWSKLYFYMKFLDVYFYIEYIYSEFQ